MEKLPEYFVIKRDENNPLWQKYIDWMNNKYGVSLKGEEDSFYGDVGYPTCTDKMHGKLITLEQWDECVNKNKKETMDKKLNGFNNGRDTTDGIGGKPAYHEMEQRKINGYKLIKKYPFSEKIGYIRNSENTSTYGLEVLSKNPAFWEPVYEAEKLEIVDWKKEDNYTHAWIMFKGKLTQEIIDKIKEIIK